MTFTHPWLLAIAALLTAGFLALYGVVQKRGAENALRYSNLAFLVGAVRAPAWPERLLAAASTAAIALMLIGAAGPHVRALMPVRDGSVVLCVDTSGSMAATDVTPTRADAALSAMRAFIAQTPTGIRIGVISFAGEAQALAAPTRNRDQIVAALQAIPPPNGATAIGDALQLAQGEMPATGPRAIVLVTDGVNNAGVNPLQAARMLGARGITLYTIGIGTNSGAFVPGTLEPAGIDEDSLRSYAAATGGAYSRAADAIELRAALARLGRTISFERRSVDVSLPSAIAGGALLALTMLAGTAAGKFP